MNSTRKLTKSHAFIDGVLCGLSVNALNNARVVEAFIQKVRESSPELADWADGQWNAHLQNSLQDATWTLEVIEYSPQ